MSSDQRSPLTKEEMNQLKQLGFKESVITVLYYELLFDKQTMIDMAPDSWKNLVDMLNKFVPDVLPEERIDWVIQLGESSNYNAEKKVITIQAGLGLSDRQHLAVEALAHELAHALSESTYWPMMNNAKSPMDYAYINSLWEGYARYHEFLAMKNIYPDIEFRGARAWKVNEQRPDDLNFYYVLDTIVSKFESEPDRIIEELAKFDKEWSPDGFFTYDELLKSRWVGQLRDIYIDYLELIDPKFNAKDYPQDTAEERVASRKKAYAKIMEGHLRSIHQDHFKILWNSAHQYFGDDGGNTLEAEKNGSALGKKINGEVLWGGIGDDCLSGSKIGNFSDVLLGGDGNDVLYGYGGVDLLAGNSGVDILFGGRGNDILKGGADIDYLYGGLDDDTLHGGDGEDELYGDEGNDTLYGGEGDDTLYGGEGVDKLYGGKGEDKYIIDMHNGVRQGSDEIDDYGGDPFYNEKGEYVAYDERPRGDGKIYIKINDNEAFPLLGQGIAVPELGEGYYRDAENPNVSYRYLPASSSEYYLPESHDRLNILYNGICVATINDYDKSSNAYGITLQDKDAQPQTSLIDFSGDDNRKLVYIKSNGEEGGSTPQVTVKTGEKYDAIVGSNASEKIESGAGYDYVLGGGGADYIDGGEGKDYLVGDWLGDGDFEGNDYIVGGADSDVIIGGGGNDIIISGNSVNDTENVNAANDKVTGDRVTAGSGDDIVFGSQNRDHLEGGVGRDIIYGNGGHDVIAGDSDSYFLPSKSPHSNSISEVDKHEITGSQQVVRELNDNDFVYAAPAWGLSVQTPHPLYPDIFPYGGTYWIMGTTLTGHYKENGITLLAEGTPKYYTLDARALEHSTQGLCDDQLFGGLGNDMICGQVGNDLLDGGDGDDLLIGDSYEELMVRGLELKYNDGTSAEGNDVMPAAEMFFTVLNLNRDICKASRVAL